MTDKLKVIVLLSGGMDSVTALYDAAERYEIAGAVTFHYGSKHNDREIPFAALHAGRLGREKVEHQHQGGEGQVAGQRAVLG